MDMFLVALCLSPAAAGAFLTGSAEHRQGDAGVRQWVMPGDKVPSELLRLAFQAAEAKSVRGGRRTRSGQAPKVRASLLDSKLGKDGQVGKAGIVEQLEDWKDHNLAVIKMDQTENAAKKLDKIQTRDFEKMLKSFVNNQETRFVFSKGNQEAQKFIMDHMKQSGLSVKKQDFTLRMSGFGSPASNIIGELRGTSKPEEFVVLGAHYDSIPQSGPAPGAEDNGSGVASMLLCAQLLSKSGLKLKRSIRFVAFTGEEIGLKGSQEFVKQLSADDKKNFRGAIIMDEVAYTKKHDHKVDVIFETSGRDRAQQVVIDTMAHTTKGIADLADTTQFQVNYAGWGSDHMSFLENDLPAVLLIEKDNLYAADKFGHTPQDDLSNIDYDFGASTANIAAASIANLALPAGAKQTL